jgi:hypothetical protein
MKTVLREFVPDLDAILVTAKADPQRQQKAEELITVLRAALSKEGAIDQMMQRIAEASGKRNPA